MSKPQKNEALVLVLALLITGGVLGGGYLLFSEFFMDKGEEIETTDRSDTIQTDNTPQPNLSLGEIILFSEPELNSDEKQAGADAFSNQNYSLAVEQFEAALQRRKNDPEALIYLNNARIGNQESYQIAVTVPVNQVSTAALEILRGVAQAQTEINQAGGINGVPLKVVIADDKNSPEAAKQIAATLSQNSDILAVVGHFSSTVTLAASQVYEQNQLVAITPTSTTTLLSNAGDFIFRTVPSDRFTADKLTQYFIQDLGLNKAAIFYNEQSEYSNSLKNELTTAIYGDGGEVVETVDISSDNFDSFQAYDSLIEQQAEAIILVPDSETVNKALRIARVNDQNLPILAGDSVYKPDTLKVGEDVVDMVLAIPWHIQENRSSNFVQIADGLWGGDINWRSAMAYDATQALAAAIASSPSREGVAQVLSKSGFSTAGATGSVRFLPSGDRNQAAELVTIQPRSPSRSGFGYDFVLLP